MEKLWLAFFRVFAILCIEVNVCRLLYDGVQDV